MFSSLSYEGNPPNRNGRPVSIIFVLVTGLKITAGQRTMSGLITDLTGQTLILPVILTGDFWIRIFYFPYSCRLMLQET